MVPERDERPLAPRANRVLVIVVGGTELVYAGVGEVRVYVAIVTLH